MGEIAFGSAEIRVNGTLVKSKKGAVARGISGEERSAVVEDTYHGHKTEAVAAECEFSITTTDDVSISDMANITDGTITFESQKSEKVFVMRNAVCSGNVELTSGSGEAKFKFFGPKWEEQ